MHRKLTDSEIHAILETGIDEFAEKGLDRANINVIARRADVSVGVIYKYFGDKDHFFLACVRHSLELLDEVLQTAIASETDVMCGIKSILCALIHHARMHASYNAMYNEISSGGCKQYAVQLASEIETRTARAYSALLENAKAAGKIDPALDSRAFAFFFDNLLMMLQFSYSCDYYRERMKIFCGEDIVSDTDRMTEEFLRFMRSALKA